MRAIRVHEFGGPEVMQLATIPEPEPAAGQMLVKIHAAGVNPVDTYIRSGIYPRKPPLPYTPGFDGAGVIAAIGNGFSRWKAGDRVYLSGSLSGTYGDHALCDTAHVHPLPAGISFAQGAALGVPYGTAHFALFGRGSARSGETVLIHGGTGGVGTAAIQIARAAGLNVLATGGTDAGRGLAREQGAHEVFDHTTPDYPDRIMSQTAGRGVDLIVEMLANVNLAKDLTLLAPRGRVVIVGSRGAIEINPRDIMSRNADVRGLMLFGATPAELATIHEALGAGLESGALRPVIGREFPLAEAARAHEAVMSAGARGKIVLVP